MLHFIYVCVSTVKQPAFIQYLLGAQCSIVVIAMETLTYVLRKYQNSKKVYSATAITFHILNT